MADQPVGHSNRSSSCTSVGMIMVHFMSNQLLLLTNGISKLFLACFFKINFSSVVHCTFYLYLINFSLSLKGTRYRLTKYPLNIIYMCSVRKILTHIFTITKSKLLYGTLKIEPPFGIWDCNGMDINLYLCKILLTGIVKNTTLLG